MSFAALVALMVSIGCASSPSGPPPTLACPAPIQVVSPDNNPLAVTFQAPSTSGSPSVQSTCEPASGTLFAIGTTAVGCSATVESTRVSCSFNVTVTPPPNLEKTRSLAFGDSITFGSDGVCPFGSSSVQWTLAEMLRFPISSLAAVANPYPTVLQNRLRERYTAQSPVVVNAGVSGEFVTESSTQQRYRRALTEQRPEIVLLQEGINDLHVLDLYGIPHSQGFALVRNALRDMSLEARGRGMHVFLGTLLPERPGACRSYAVPPVGTTDLIRPTNDLIRSMAAAEGIDLIDLYALFEGHLDDYLAQDGLHPSEAGYAAIAGAFFDAIKQKFEKPLP